MTPLISICLPTYQRAQLLAPTLERVAKIIAPLRDRVEICISDNASNDGTSKVIANFTDLRLKHLRQSTNVGFSRNLAAAIALAEGEYLLCMGDDDALANGLCDTLEQALAERPAVVLFSTLPDQPMDGDWEARRKERWLQDGREVARVLGIFHLTFLGNFIARRTDYLIHDDPAFCSSLYPHVPVLLRIMAAKTAKWIPKPLFEFEEQTKSWNQPLLTAVDLTRIYTDENVASSAFYDRTVRSIPRALLNKKLGHSDQPGNRYASLSLANLLACYRHSRRHQIRALAFWLAGSALPAQVLQKILGNEPRKVFF